MQGDALLRSGRPSRARSEQLQSHAACELQRLGADAYALLVQRKAVKQGVRCNFAVLGVAAQVELYGVPETSMARMLRDANLDPRSVRHSLKTWRQLLANLGSNAPRATRRCTEWALADEPGCNGRLG